MPDFYWGENANGTGDELVAHLPNAKSCDGVTNPEAFFGVPLCLSTYTGLTTSSMPVLRPLLPADITALFTQTTVAGIYGFAKHGFKTDSSGIANKQSVYSGKSAYAEPISNVPSIGFSLNTEPTNGYTRSTTWLAVPGMRFWAKLYTGLTASQALVETNAGIDITGSGTTASPYVYTVNTAGNSIAGTPPGSDVKTLRIVDWDQYDPDKLKVLVEVRAAYCQSLTNVTYTAQ